MLFYRAISLVGLALISLGTGGIKPCVSAFGADQFKLPEQEVYGNEKDRNFKRESRLCFRQEL